MRIALDGFPLLPPRAGVGQYTRHLVAALARVGSEHTFVVICPRPAPLLHLYDLPDFCGANVEVVGLGAWESVRYGAAKWTERQASVERLIGEVDVYHATNNTFPAPIERARRVVTIHDMTLFLHPEWHPRERVDAMTSAVARAAEEADQIVTPSASTTNDVARLLGVDPARIIAIPEAADEVFRPLDHRTVERALRPFDLRPGEYLLYLGTIEPRKNLIRLLDAVEPLGGDVGPLVVAGRPGWQGEEIQRRLAAAERIGRVRRLGYVRDEIRPVLLNGARAFLYPSLYEGFGLPPLEAMACGTPVVTSIRGSLPEVAGDAALLVDPCDIDALSAGVRRVWCDAGLRACLSERGRQRAAEFSWSRTAWMTLEVYRAACGDRRGPGGTAPRVRQLHS